MRRTPHSADTRPDAACSKGSAVPGRPAGDGRADPPPGQAAPSFPDDAGTDAARRDTAPSTDRAARSPGDATPSHGATDASPGHAGPLSADAAPSSAGAGAGSAAGAVLLDARGLALRGERGWAYRDVGLALPAGRLAAVTGEAGTGRTSLLLTLAGRMRPTAGTLVVAGREQPSAIRRVAAIGETQGVNELDDALTVAEHVFERRHLRPVLLPRRRARRAEDVGATLAPLGLDLDPDTLVGDLPPYERRLVGAALALMDHPLLLVLDDVDRGMRAGHRRALWSRLRELTRATGVTVVASRVDAAPDLADVEVTL